jgi:hypothetical protein
MRLLSVSVLVFLVVLSTAAAWAQAPDAASTPAPTETAPASPEAAALETAKTQVSEIAEKVNEDERAQQVSAGILDQIYQLAERFSFPMYHWVAFALMVSGVISFALQLTLGKLFVLAKMSISPSEILGDIQGLVISLVGLVLTTQAAAENSTFTQSPASVLSATAVGAATGYLFYRWGKAQELAAADGRKVAAKAPAAPAAK